MAQTMDIGITIKELGLYDIEPLKAKTLGLPQEGGDQFHQLEYEVHQLIIDRLLQRRSS